MALCLRFEAALLFVPACKGMFAVLVSRADAARCFLDHGRAWYHDIDQTSSSCCVGSLVHAAAAGGLELSSFVAAGCRVL